MINILTFFMKVFGKHKTFSFRRLTREQQTYYWALKGTSKEDRARS